MARPLLVLTACAVSALVGGAVALSVWGGEATSPAGPQASPVQVPAAAPVLSPQPAAATAAPAAAPAPGRLRLPDGSEVEPLNGVKAPPAMVWGETPYAPIVGREFGNGIEWYVHADGTRSTTLDRWRDDLGRRDSVTLVAHPKAPVPVEAGAADPGK
jgi:hypothetical protein